MSTAAPTSTHDDPIEHARSIAIALEQELNTLRDDLHEVAVQWADRADGMTDPFAANVLHEVAQQLVDFAGASIIETGDADV